MKNKKDPSLTLRFSGNIELENLPRQLFRNKFVNENVLFHSLILAHRGGVC